jgi:hypothetical protein
MVHFNLCGNDKISIQQLVVKVAATGFKMPAQFLLLTLRRKIHHLATD